MAGGGIKVNNIKVSGGADGATFTPSVDENGNLSWDNDRGYANPHTVNIKGADGKNGADGKTGAKILSQTFKGEDANGGYIYEQLFDDGTVSYFTAPRGQKGDAGSIKFITVNELPTENIDESAIYLVPTENSGENNIFAEYVYIDGAWEKLGEIPVQFDHSEYVKFTDYATTAKVGVMKIMAGLKNDGNGGVATNKATTAMIDAKDNSYCPIVPSTIDYALKVAVTTNTETLTDTEKADACEWLGALAKNTSPGSYTKFYAVDLNGNQIMFNMSDGNYAQVGTLPHYYGPNTSYGDTDAGGILITGMPKRNAHATPKKYVDEEVAKVKEEVAEGYVAQEVNTSTVVKKVYGVAENSTLTTMLPVTDKLLVNTIPYRGANGTFQVSDPVEYLEVANKNYVDNIVNKPYELIEEFTLTEVSNFVRTQEPDGTAYNFKEVAIDITYGEKVGATNYIKTNISTFWHMVGDTTKYSVYRLSVKNGVYDLLATNGAYRDLSTAVQSHNRIYLTNENITSTNLSRDNGFPIGTTFKIYGVRA